MGNNVAQAGDRPDGGKYTHRREAEELRKLRGRLSAYQVQNPAWPNIKLRARIAELSELIETAHCDHCGTPVAPWAEKCYSCLGELSAAQGL